MNGPIAELKEVVSSISRRIQPIPGGTVGHDWFRDEIGKELRKRGRTIEPEYFMPNVRKDGRNGRIDLVVTAPYRLAVEVDRLSPREKSIKKLKAFDGLSAVVLRKPQPHVVPVKRIYVQTAS